MGVKYDTNKGKWVASYSERHPITRQPVRLARQAETEKEAARLVHALKREVKLKLIEQASPSWRTIVSKYLEDLKLRGVTEDTIHDRRVTVEKHTGSRWSKKRIRDIQSSDVYSLMNEDSIKALSIGTQRKFLRTLKSIMKFAVNLGCIPRDPTPEFHFKDHSRDFGFLSKSQCEQLLRSAIERKSEWYPIWLTAILTGMRNGELYALKWGDVNFDTNIITVQRSWNAINGFKSPKSGKSRHVSMNLKLVRLFRELAAKSGKSEFVLPRPKGWEHGSQAAELKAFLVSIGIPPIRFHDLRATWATFLLNESIAAAKIQASAGWKEYETMDRYIRRSGIDVVGINDVIELNLEPTEETRTKVMRPVQPEVVGHQQNVIRLQNYRIKTERRTNGKQTTQTTSVEQPKGKTDPSRDREETGNDDPVRAL